MRAVTCFIGVEFVVQGTHGAGFIRQVTLGHTYVGRTEIALAWTGVWLGQHGDHCHTRLGAHRFHTDAADQFRVGLPLAAAYQLTVGGHQHLFTDVSPHPQL